MPVHIETIKINKFDIENSAITNNLLRISPTKFKTSIIHF